MLRKVHKGIDQIINILDKLQVGNIIDGQAIIEGRDTTVVVPHGYRVTVDEYLNLIMEHR